MRFQALFTRKVFMPFFTLGDPDFDASFEMIQSAIDAGADCLELGIAFSDPIADGPTNQRSMSRALNSDMSFERSCELIHKVREYSPEIPIGLLVYYNLLYHNGVNASVEKLATAGVDAIVCGDLPIEEGADFDAACDQHGVGQVYILAPNTPDDRAKQIFERCNAYTYVLSGYGPTGAKDEIAPETIARVQHLRTLTEKPMIVGFGISKPAHVQAIWEAGADGAIVGSYFTSLIEQNLSELSTAQAEISAFIKKGSAC